MTGNEIVRFVAALVVIGASAYLVFRTDGWLPLICAVAVIAGIILIDLIQGIRRRRRDEAADPAADSASRTSREPVGGDLR
ncbi:hypothetical protein ACH0BO_02795 [Brevibacterium luteolum]|uniref:hypothetical protein n=1 Tax=Brevibacterium luteolum TaxID=199591 RepID=UPI0038798AF7